MPRNPPRPAHRLLQRVRRRRGARAGRPPPALHVPGEAVHLRRARPAHRGGAGRGHPRAARYFGVTPPQRPLMHCVAVLQQSDAAVQLLVVVRAARRAADAREVAPRAGGRSRCSTRRPWRSCSPFCLQGGSTQKPRRLSALELLPVEVERRVARVLCRAPAPMSIAATQSLPSLVAVGHRRRAVAVRAVAREDDPEVAADRLGEHGGREVRFGSFAGRYVAPLRCSRRARRGAHASWSRCRRRRGRPSRRCRSRTRAFGCRRGRRPTCRRA